jgi:hypothetical protein
MLMKIKEYCVGREGEKYGDPSSPAAPQDDRMSSADLFAAFGALRVRGDRQAKRPLTRPAPAGESAGSGPPSPLGEG